MRYLTLFLTLFAALEALPGLGHKTACVVMAQSFSVPAFPRDTHIHRLATRWKLTSCKNVVQTERDLKNLFPRDSWNKSRLQIIFFGREHCSACGCDWKICLLCRELFAKSKRSLKMALTQKVRFVLALRFPFSE